MLAAVWAVTLILGLADRWFGPAVGEALRVVLPKDRQWVERVPLLVQLVSLLIALGVVVAVGWLSTFLAVRKAITLGEDLVSRIPVVKFFYHTPKEVIRTLTSAKADTFRRVVLIEWPRRDAWCLAFATAEVLVERDGVAVPHVAVFMPSTPNPTSGFLMFLPAEDVRDTAIAVEEGVRMIMSGGLLSPRAIATSRWSGLGRGAHDLDEGGAALADSHP
jgi:uncharacterized membrane protein